MALTPDLPLVGRDDLLARLIAAIDAGAGGQAQAVVLCGEPGAGKSRLAQEAAAVAAARGFRVLSSTGSPLQRDLHYGVLIDVLRPLVRRGPSGARVALVEGLTALAPLFDDLGLPTVEALGDSGLERTRLFESVRRLLERAARQQPLLIVVDDSHWADSASLAVLAYALVGSQDSRLCLVAARRSGESDPADAGFVDALRRVRHTTELEVGSLDQPGIRAMAARLLGGEPPQALVELLADRSGGLPLFVRGIVSQLVASRRLTRVGGHWVVDSMDGVELPSEVRELVRARLESLSPDQCALVDLVAVAGGAISHSLLTSASPTDPLPALQRLINGGTIVEDLTGSGVAYRLMHPLVTEVAAGLLPEVGRRRLHARLAAAVSRDDPTQLGLLAHHMTEGMRRASHTVRATAGSTSSGAAASSSRWPRRTRAP
jgi:predicted ATPase